MPLVKQTILNQGHRMEQLQPSAPPMADSIWSGLGYAFTSITTGMPLYSGVRNCHRGNRRQKIRWDGLHASFFLRDLGGCPLDLDL